MIALLKHALATIAVADVLSNEKIGEPVRERFGIKHRDTGDPYSYDPESFVSSMLWCVFCTSYWVAGGLAVLRVLSKPLYGLIVTIFAGAWLGGLIFRGRQKYL